MKPAPALLILHGKQALNEEVRQAVQHWRETHGGKRSLAVRVTWEGGDTQRLVHEAVAQGYGRLIAGGGDGTLREVASAILDGAHAVSLAVLPLGTANDFARAAAIPLQPGPALALLDEEPVAVDVGELRDGHFFINMATGGFGANVTANTPEELKRVLGGGAYLLSGLSRFGELNAAHGRFHGPDFHWEGSFLAMGIGNGRQAGGGQVLCPQARIDDGLLDICVLPAPADTVATLGTLLSGGLLGLESISLTARLPWLDIELDGSLDLNLDGEPLLLRDMHLRVRPGALRMHLPQACPLLA
ncbi:lipid kinase YegS [Stutzerimonas kirkiae]|uniref:Probable lipid kinase YegS-like n=1 Tax=Stutzerimonas kirkiae TaxID=2211392 RepID=A0A4Q9RAL7_9GAMM|nr:lipid kinase YegS [Stutzerimonas kirkiae]TBU97206.1 lipid kinase YegS [Stutzerimonas kirkiae]TBV03628.1 lipid kinase YegS [Stutzerimonas kirkiae]